MKHFFLSTFLGLTFLLCGAGLNAQYAGNAISFDSISSYAALTNPGSLTPLSGSAFTLESWVYVDASDIWIASSGYVSKVLGYVYLGTQWSFGIHPYNGGQFRVVLNAGATQVGSSISATPNTWNHVAVTCDGFTTRFMVNGVPAGIAGPVMLTQSNTSTVLLGTRFSPGYGLTPRSIDTIVPSAGISGVLLQNPHGRLDNLRMWNVARSANQIVAGLVGDVSSANGLLINETFEGGTGINLWYHPAYVPSGVPAFPRPYQNAVLDWNALPSATSSLLSISSDAITATGQTGTYLLCGYSGGDSSFSTGTGIPGLATRMNRTWGLLPIGAESAHLVFAVPPGIENPYTAVVLVATDSALSQNLQMVVTTYDATTNTVACDLLFEGGNTELFVSLGTLPGYTPYLYSNFPGPYWQSYETAVLFTVIDLPSGTDEVQFLIKSTYGGSVLDSQTVEVSTVGEARYTAEMGTLPVGAVLDIRFISSVGTPPITMTKPLPITEVTPHITSTDDFGPYVLGTSRTNTYTVDSLPSNTTAITFRIIDGNGIAVRFTDSSGNVIFDSSRVTGTDLSSASWTVQLDTLEIPLSSQLSVTVEHIYGFPGGTVYTVPLQVLNPPMKVFSDNGWGPFVSNNYTRVVSTQNPWNDVPKVFSQFALEELPPRAEKVIFALVDTGGTILVADTLLPSNAEWIVSAESSEFSMTDQSPTVAGVQVTVFAQGGPDAGIVSFHEVQIVPQSPRVFLNPSEYTNAPRNPANPGDTTTTPVTFTVEVSTAQTDSVALRFVDADGSTLDRLTTSSVGSNGVVSFTYNLATLPYTVRGAEAIVYSSVSLLPVDSLAPLSMIPPRPILKSTVGLDDYVAGDYFIEQFSITGLLPAIDSLQFLFRGSLLDSYRKNTIPISHSLHFDGTTSITTPRQEPTGTIVDKGFCSMLWFRTSQTTVAPLFGVQASGTYYPILYIDDAGRLHATLYGSTGTRDIVTDFRVNDGEWHHAAIIYPQDVGLQLYVDGGLVGWWDLEPETALDENGEYLIGRGATTQLTGGEQPSQYFEGDMSEISFWMGGWLNARSVESYLYNPIAKPTTTTNLSVYLPLSEGGGTNATNRVTGASLPIGGNVEWSVNDKLNTVGASLNIGALQLAPGPYDLTLRTFYPGGDPAGTDYIWQGEIGSNVMNISGENYAAEFWTDEGFGPFRQGTSAAPLCTLALAPAPPLNTTVTFNIVDSLGKVLATQTGYAVQGASQWIGSPDMGGAQPGSKLRVDVNGVSIAFPLVVLPATPPRLSGHTGPFKAAIVPGTMSAENTFTIVADVNDARFVGRFVGPGWEGIDTVAAAQRDDTTWAITYDMSTLTPPLSRLIVETYYGQDIAPSVRDTLTLTITPTRPLWFDGDAAFTGIMETGDSIKFTVTSYFADPSRFTGLGMTLDSGELADVRSAMSLQLANEVPLISDQIFAAPFPRIACSVSFNSRTNRLILMDAPQVSGALSLFGNSVPVTIDTGNYYLDSANNLNVNSLTTWQYSGNLGILGKGKDGIAQGYKALSAAFKNEDATKDVEIAGPYVGIVPSIVVGGSVHVHTGSDGEEWGAIGSLDLTSDDTSSASYQVTQIGLGITLQIGVQALYGAASCEFDLTFRGLVGLGSTYNDFPQPESQLLTSAGIQLYGQVNGSFLWGLYTKTLWGPDMFYHKEWGDPIPVIWPEPSNGWIWSGTAPDEKGDDRAVAGLPAPSATSAAGATAFTPIVFPQPAVTSRNSALASVYMEQDPATGLGTLMISVLPDDRTSFDEPIMVVSNHNAISNPRVDNLSDTVHIVTWTQSRCTPHTIPSGATPTALARSLDVWYAIVNSATGIVEHVGIMNDDLDSSVAGRLEGNADVTALSSNEGMVAWIAADLERKTSDLFYAVVKKDGGIWSASEPTVAADLSGMEHNLRITATGQGSAIAAWINQENSESSERDVMSMTWNGSTWSLPAVVLPSSPGIIYNYVDMTSEGEHGLLAVTGLQENAEGSEEMVLIVPWEGGRFNTAALHRHRDTIGYIQRPRIAISANGKTVLALQRNNSATDGSSRISQIDLLVNDLSITGEWRYVDAHELLCDTLSSIWGLESMLRGDALLLFSNELKSPLAVHSPQHGIFFGKPPMNLVLRAVELSDTLGIVDADENAIGGTSSAPHVTRSAPSFEIEGMTPNPFRDRATVDYRLGRSGTVRLEMTDALGRRISLPVDERQSAGFYHVELPGDDLPNGAYVITLTLDGESISRTLLKMQ